MRGTVVPRDSPSLTLGEVREVLAHWGLTPVDRELRWHSPRPFSAATIVDLADRPVFVKRHDARVRTPANLREEHRFMRHLSVHGAPVCSVLDTTAGDSALSLDAWTYEVHEAGVGNDLYREAPSWTPFLGLGHAMAAGRALARLHVAARGYAAPARCTEILIANDRILNAADPLDAVTGTLERRPALDDYLRRRDWRTALARVIAPFHAPYLTIAPHLPRLWTHNDWHASNLLWSDRGPAATVRTIFDFGLCDRTTAVFDLATAIERNVIPWLEIQAGRAAAADLALMTGLVHAYLSETALSPAESVALPALLPLVHVGLAITEIDYFHGVAQSAENADLAYHGFLLGHCEWFARPEGRALLDHLRALLESHRVS